VAARLKKKYGITDDLLREHPLLRSCVEIENEACVRIIVKEIRKEERAKKREGRQRLEETQKEGGKAEGGVARKGRGAGGPKVALWQNMSLLLSLPVSLIPYVSLLAVPLAVLFARARWPVRMPVAADRDGALVYRGKRLWPVAVEGVAYTLESMEPIEAIATTATIVDAINGVYYDGGKYYVLVENPDAVKKTDVIASKLKLGDVEKVKWPFEVGHKRDEWLGVLAHFLLGAALLPAYLTAGASLLIGGALAAWLTYAESKYARPQLPAISANNNIRGSADPEAFYARAVSSLPPSRVFMVWDRYPDFFETLAKVAERKRKWYTILSPSRLPEIEDLYRAYFRFRHHGIQEVAYLAVGMIDVPSPELAGFKLGNPRRFPMLSADAAVVSPPRLARPWRESGIPVGLAESGKGQYVFCADIDVEKSPHVLVVGATGTGKTTQAMAIARAISERYGARIVAVDPHGHWLGLDGAVEYNVSRCLPPIRLHKENVDWVVDAFVAAGYVASDYMLNSLRSLLYRIAVHHPGTPLSRLHELVDPTGVGMDAMWLGALYSFETECEADLPEEGHVIITSRGLMSAREVARTVVTLHYAIDGAVRRAGRYVAMGETAPPQRIVIVDEAHKFMPQTAGGLAIDSLLAQVRKFGIIMILITQNLQDVSQRAITNIGHVLVFWWGRSPAESHLLASVLQTDVTTVYKMQDLTIAPDTHRDMRCYYYIGKVGKQAVKLCMPKALLDKMMTGYVPPCGRVVRIVGRGQA